MLISIDASTATPYALRLAASILTFIANTKDGAANHAVPSPSNIDLAAQLQAARNSPPAAPSETLNDEKKLPETETPPAGSADSTALLDAHGVAWDPELHTANQSKNSDGTWRRKRTEKPKVSTQTVQIPESLKPQVPPPPPETKPAVESVATVPPAPIAAAPPVAPAAPAVPPAPPVSTAVLPVMFNGVPVADFATLVKYATNAIGKKQISTSGLIEACAECGVPDLHACSIEANFALIPTVAAAIQKRIAK